MLGASLSAPLCREGGREGGWVRGRDLTSLFFLSLHAGAGKHMSPLHSGQEDKRGRKGGIGIWERRRRRREVECLKKEKTEKSGLFPRWVEINSSAWARKQRLILWPLDKTNQHTKAEARIWNWKLCATTSTNLGFPIDRSRNTGTLFYYFPFFCFIQNRLFVG